MKKLLPLLALFFLWPAPKAHSQELINCIAATSTPCSSTVKIGTGGQGDPAWKAFGKTNDNVAALWGVVFPSHSVTCTNGSTGAADDALLAAAFATGGSITLKASCTVAQKFAPISHTIFNGNGYTVTAAAAGNWPGGTLAGFISPSGATDITVENTDFVWPNGAGGVHILEFPSGNSKISVLNNTSTGAGDFVACSGCSDIQEIGNKAYSASNACYDAWFGATGVTIMGNICSMYSGANVNYGILWTGFDTNDNPTNNTSFKAIGNTIYLNSTTDSGNNVGIWLQGNPTCGSTADDYDNVADNHIILAAGVFGVGLRATGCVNNAIIHSNIITSDGVTQTSHGAIEAFTPSTNISIEDNIVQNWDTTGALFRNTGTGGTLNFNHAYGTLTYTTIDSVGTNTTVQKIGDDNGTGVIGFTSTAGGTAAMSMTNTGNAGFNYTADLLDPNLTTGNKVSFRLGQSLATGDAIQQIFSYTGNNNGANYWSISMYGVGNDFLKWIYSPDELQLGDGGLISAKGLFRMKGTTFTVASGTGTCAATGSLVGGNQAGHFQCTTAGTAASTATLTLQGGATSYTCWGRDITTPTTVTQTGALSTTAVTITLASVTQNDVIEFGCLGY